MLSTHSTTELHPLPVLPYFFHLILSLWTGDEAQGQSTCLEYTRPDFHPQHHEKKLWLQLC
jgi:hypothetical protein